MPTSHQITSYDEFLAFFDQVSPPPVDEIEFSGWPVIRVNIKGTGYESSIHTDLMRYIIELEDCLKTAYAIAHYDGNRARLTEDDRRRLRINVTVSHGSSDLVADLTDGFVEVMKNMESKHKALVLGALITTAGAYFAYDRYLEHSVQIASTEADMARTESSEATVLELAKIQAETNDQLIMLADKLASIPQSLASAVADAEEMTFNGSHFTKQEIKELSEKPRISTRQKEVNATIRVGEVKNVDNELYKSFATIDGERIPLSFQLSMIGEPAVEALIAAIKDKSELQLQVRARYKDDKIISGIVIKVNDFEPLSLLPPLPDE